MKHSHTIIISMFSFLEIVTAVKNLPYNQTPVIYFLDKHIDGCRDLKCKFQTRFYIKIIGLTFLTTPGKTVDCALFFFLLSKRYMNQFIVEN